MISVNITREIPKTFYQNPNKILSKFKSAQNQVKTSAINQNKIPVNFSTCQILKSKNALNIKAKSRYGKLFSSIAAGFGVGGLASAAYLYNNYRQVNAVVISSQPENSYILNETPPESEVARSIQNNSVNNGLKITLYQFQTCPFCCKVRTFLDYYGFPYDVIEVNSVTHKQTKWSTYRKVPFLVVKMDGSEKILQLKDSSMIISALQSFLVNKNETLDNLVKGYPIMENLDEDGKVRPEIMNRFSILYGEHHKGRSKEDISKERKWRAWTDNVYVHTLSPNVYRTMEESFQAFKWFSEVGNWESNFATWERLLVINVGALAMYFIGKRLKKRHHLKWDVRESFYDETNVWLKEVQKSGGLFAGGDKPNLADLSVFGVLTAVEGCDAFQDLLNNTKIEPWFNRMKKAVKNRDGQSMLIDRGRNML